MSRDELIALRNALDAMLTWPEPVRAQIAAWLTSASPKPGNGVDPDPPAVAPGKSPETDGFPRPPRPDPEAPAPRPKSVATRKHGGARERAEARNEERKLLAAMRTSPGASANTLAKTLKCSRSSVQDRLRRLSASGAIEKTPDGWRIAGEGSRPISPPSP